MENQVEDQQPVAAQEPGAQPEAPLTGAELFRKEYEELCARTGYTFTVEPKPKRNADGSYDFTTVIIETQIAAK